MSTRVAQLAVDVASDVADAVSGLGDVGAASAGASSDVAKMGNEAQDAARKLNITADSADELGGKAGKATGALGALSSGFELVGAGKYAAGLQGAALATDFFSGVGDSLNLVMESTIVKTGLAKLAMVGHAVASGASAVATGVMTGAQWALNAAMSANPIALVVIAIVALTAGIIIAYKKSETFRAIVGGAFSTVKDIAVGAFNWIRNNWPLLLAILTGPFGLAVLAIVKKWDSITGGAKAAKEFIVRKIGELPGDIGKIADDIGDALTAPFEDAIDLVKDLVDWIGKIHVPHISIPGLRTTGGTTPQSSLFGGTTTVEVKGGPTYNYTFNLNGLVTDNEAADVIAELLDRRARQLGLA